MKQTKVKIISAILALAMVICTSPKAFAAAISSTPAENEIFVQFDGHGQYTEVTSTLRSNIAQDLNAQAVGRVVVATATDDEDLYSLSQNDYLLRVGPANDEDRTFLRVERMDVGVDNFSADALGEFNFPAEVVEQITSVVDEQIARGNDSFGLSVFKPALNSTPQTASSQNGASTYGHTETWYDYYTRFGEQFTDYYVKYWNSECKVKDKTSRAAETAGAITSFLFTCAGLGSTTVVAFQFGYSALKTLAVALGVDEVSAGSGYNSIQVLVTYDAVRRVTYWNMGNGGADPYVSTCKAWLNTNFTQQSHDAFPSGGFQTQTYLNEEMLSPHYDDPSGWLYNDYYDASGVVEGPIYTTIHNERFLLV